MTDRRAYPARRQRRLRHSMIAACIVALINRRRGFLYRSFLSVRWASISNLTRASKCWIVPPYGNLVPTFGGYQVSRPPRSGIEAWESLAASKNARWHSNIDRFKEFIPDIDYRPKFTLSRNDQFFCIGSCFARNVEEHLIYTRCSVLSKRIMCPAHEWSGRPNGLVNKFTTHSMLNEVDWALRPPKITQALFEQTAQGWFDLQLSPGVRPVSLDRAIERRAYLTNEYFRRLADTSVVIVTLGLNEVWYDSWSRRYLNAGPSLYAARRQAKRYRVEFADVDSTVRALEHMRKRLLRLNPNMKLIVTVSPVPMSETFSGKDVGIANILSKATLRVAAESFSSRHAAVEYFPAFEMITLAPRQLAYAPDCLHVNDKAVAIIMQRFAKSFFGFETSLTSFIELAYLTANPDVDNAVRMGLLESGFEHWVKYGQAEGRPLAPPSGPTDVMIISGAV
jgi:hypothetical protein